MSGRSPFTSPSSASDEESSVAPKKSTELYRCRTSAGLCDWAIRVDVLRKVYEIFTSLSVDPGVKKSAVDQFAIILQERHAGIPPWLFIHSEKHLALLLSNDDRTCYEVSHILTLLLFDEQARFFT
ncbi:hypothetical protein MAR_026228, partial [Mya arenaria]